VCPLRAPRGRDDLSEVCPPRRTASLPTSTARVPNRQPFSRGPAFVAYPLRVSVDPGLGTGHFSLPRLRRATRIPSPVTVSLLAFVLPRPFGRDPCPVSKPAPTVRLPTPNGLVRRQLPRSCRHRAPSRHPSRGRATPTGGTHCPGKSCAGSIPAASIAAGKSHGFPAGPICAESEACGQLPTGVGGEPCLTDRAYDFPG
jgi:hypothetical protein